MTADERLVLQTTIILHGFELYERWLPDSGFWLPNLVGSRRSSDGAYECIPITKEGSPLPIRIWMMLATHHQRMHWFKLTDSQLQAFYNTVLSTC